MMRSLLFLFLLLFSKSLSAQKLQRIGHLSYAPLTLAGCWHHVDQAGGEWALVGTSAGLSIVDLQDPTQPVEKFSVPGLLNNWREVRTWAGYAYVTSEAVPSGVTIVNLNFLPDSIQWKVWRGDGFFDSLVVKSHSVQAVDGYLYLNGGASISNGVVIASLSDPWNPHILSKYAATYVHDSFIRGDTLWTSEGSLSQFGVVDISDRSNPVLLTTHPLVGGYSHNTELSDNGQILFTTSETTGAPLAAFDVSKLDDIRLLDLYLPSKKPQGEVHNVRVVEGDFLVCPSYRGQLTLVDASQPDNLVEIAWDSLGNSLVWDADPYLPSGILFATAKSEGLFIYEPTYARAARVQGTVTDASTGLPLAGAKVFVINTLNADTTGVNGVYKTGAAVTGTYALRAERTGYQTQVVTNVPLESGTTLTRDFALIPLNSAVENPEAKLWARVTPTLFDDFLQLEISPEISFQQSSLTLVLRDALGKSVGSKHTSAQASIVWNGLQGLAPGIYLLQVSAENGLNQIIRLVKN